MHQTGWYARSAGNDMEFAYYICDNGTEEDRKKDTDNMFKLMDMGYLGFSDQSSGIMTMYRPFKIGIPQPQRREEYRFGCRGCAQEC